MNGIYAKLNAADEAASKKDEQKKAIMAAEEAELTA